MNAAEATASTTTAKFSLGIAGREARAAAGAMAAMAFLQLAVTTTSAIRGAIQSQQLRFDDSLFAASWAGSLVIVGLSLGVLCGAEERENGTLDFAFRLPLARWRVLTGKIAGSALAVACWGALSLLLGSLLSAVCGEGPGAAMMSLIHAGGYNVQIGVSVVWAGLFYTFGMAAGAWIGKVIPAAIAGSLGAWLFVLAVFQFTSADGRLLAAMIQKTYMMPTAWAGAVAALAAAFWRFQRMEGR